MLSPAVRAAAAQFAGSNLEFEQKAVELGYLAGYAAGYRAPRTARFPLPGDAAFKRLLGAYLAEGITVYHPHSGRYGVLRGLPACYEHDGQPFADVEFYADAEAREEACGELTEDVSKILPVLYSFEDLAAELLLPDGRRVVPAVEALRIALGDMEELDERCDAVHKIVCRYEPSKYTPWVRVESYPSHLGGWIRRTATCDWHFEGFDNLHAMWVWKAYQWLLSAGFAVGLAPHQYHRRVVGFDYASGGKPEAPGCAGCARKEVCRG